MSKTVAETLVAALEQLGVRQIFGLIGDSLNPLADAIRHSKIEWVGVRHEEGAALAAAGQAKLTGQLAVCCGTTGPGSTHLVAGLYEAQRDHAPVLALSGDMPRRLQGTDHIQTTTPDLLFRDVSLYTETIATAEQAPKVIHQAIAAAYAGRGVAHLTLPQDVIGGKASGAVLSVDTLQPRHEFPPRASDVAKMVQLIDKADTIAILCGNGCRDAVAEVRALAERLQAPIAHTLKAKDMMPYADPYWMGGIGMIGTKPMYNAVNECDLLLMLGTDYPYSEFLPDDATVIQVDERVEVLGRRAPTVMGVMASVLPTLQSLLPRVGAKTERSFFDKIAEQRVRWDEKLDEQCDLKRSEDRIHPQAVARLAGDMAQPDAIFVLDTGLNTLWSGNWLRQSGRQRILGSFNNAAVGTALGQANGIQALDRGRQVIVLSGDGGFNMLMGEFMTAVHHKLPIKVVIFNNSSFGLIAPEAEQAGLPAYRQGIDFPNPDYVALARACGAQGFVARRPDQLKGALAGALAVDGPAIVDCVVVADELPNVPHLELGMLTRYAKAKVKEAVLAVTGA
jgi:thiamine pyrophosphate-dependent acetolactate synthase large subunit-like protein